jgi:hypothetical protein
MVKLAIAHHGHVVHHVVRDAALPSAWTVLQTLISTILVMSAVVGGIIAIVLFVNFLQRTKRLKAQEKSQEAPHDEMVKALAPWMQQPLPPIAIPPGLALEQGEAAYYSGNANILGAHTTTRRVGGSAGPSFRVARGVWFHTSAFASQPVRQTYTAVDDHGVLTVTNKRVIFVGGKHSLAFPLAKILSLTPFVDGVQIDPENRTAVVFQTGNQIAAIVTHRAREGSLNKSIPSGEVKEA